MKYLTSTIEHKLVGARWRGDPWLIEDVEGDYYRVARYEIYRLGEQEFIDLYTKAEVDPEKAAAWLDEYEDSEVHAEDELLAESLSEEVLV